MDGPWQARERVIGRYALYDEIASGGMATVHLGRLIGPSGLGRTVAIKRMHPQFAKDPDFSAMFLDEARVAMRVQHANVVATLDVVALDGELFHVMDFVQGETLSRLLRAMRANQETVQLPIAAQILSGVLFGLHAAHEARSEQGEPLAIVHRDVSPQNVMVGADGTARVLDFGVARAAGRVQTTRDGQLKGKIPYMSREQVMGEPIDRRSDIYAASVVLWELLTGRRLFDGESDAAVLAKVANGVIYPPSRFVGGIPERLDALVMCGLAARREARFATAWDMAVALEEVVGLAAPRHVAAWVERLASGTLARRVQRVKEIESVSARSSAIREEALRSGAAEPTSGVVSSPSYGQPVTRVTSPSEPTRAVMTTTEQGPTAAGATWRVPLLLGMITVFLMVIAVASVRSIVVGERGAAALPPPAAAPPVPPASESAAVTARAPALEGSPAVSSSTAPAPVAPVAAIPALADAAAAPPGTTSAPAVSSLPPATTVRGAPTGIGRTGRLPDQDQCSPPFTLDAHGIRRPKPECL